MKLSAIKTDPDRIEGGGWVDDIPNLPGVRIKARGIGNKDYRVLEGKLLRALPRGLRTGGIDPEDQDRITGRLLLETVVLDVDGLTDDAGAPLVYSRDLGEQLLLDPAYRVFQAGASYAGAFVADRRKADEEADVKN